MNYRLPRSPRPGRKVRNPFRTSVICTLGVILPALALASACTALPGGSGNAQTGERAGNTTEHFPQIALRAPAPRTPTAVPAAAVPGVAGALQAVSGQNAPAAPVDSASGMTAPSAAPLQAAAAPAPADSVPAVAGQNPAGTSARDDDGADGQDDGDDPDDEPAGGSPPPAVVDTPPPAPAPVNSCPSLPAGLLDQLRAGGMVVYLRHGTTDWSQSEREEEWVEKWPEIPPHASEFEDCSQQRLLTDDGRALASAIGRAVSAAGIPVGRVLSSRWCRVIDTAQLAFGSSQTDDRLFDSGYLEKDSSDRKRYRSELRSLLAERPAGGQNLFIVGHMPQLLDATGIALEEGTAAVFRPDGGGHETVVPGMTLGDWECLAGS